MGHYSLSNLLRALRNPQLFAGELNRVGTIGNQQFHRRFTSTDATPVVDLDWDVLLILDACRYDVFSELSLPNATLTPRTTPGSNSEEFIAANFLDRTLHDTVYVTANAHAEGIPDGTFHRFVPLYTDEYWDEDLRVVPPNVVATEVRNVATNYPDKRIIVHFMQPHMPPIGSLRHWLPAKGNVPPGRAHPDQDKLSLKASFRHRVNGATQAAVEAAYRENLALVLDEVLELLPDLDGKVAITADHGELLGERLWPIPVRGVFHMFHVRHEKLNTVPWCTFDGERRDVRADPPERAAERVSSETVESRLEDLGYR